MKNDTYDFVLDCSVTMTWCFEDEKNDFSDEILERLKNEKAIVPSIWSLEVANVLLLSKKRKRISEIEVSTFIDDISQLPIIVEQSTANRAKHSIFVLADEMDLTIYDATYLELAIREKIPLYTLDKQLIKAAKKMQVQTSH